MPTPSAIQLTADIARFLLAFTKLNSDRRQQFADLVNEYMSADDDRKLGLCDDYQEAIRLGPLGKVCDFCGK